MSYADLARLVTFRPLERPLTGHAHSRSPFKARWTSTVTLLGRELRLHGARAAVMEIDIPESAIRQDGMPRADRRASSPGIVLSFDATHVPGRPHLRYEVTSFYEWQDNVRAVALALEALRAVDRYGVTRRGEQYAGWKQLVAGAGGEGDAARGRELILAAGSVTEALKRTHPDHGGSDEDFRDVIAARDDAARHSGRLTA